MARVEVSKVNIKIGDKEIELSLEEAKELRDILCETLAPEVKEPTKIIERIIERHDYWPYTRWTYSYTPTITCKDTSGYSVSGQHNYLTEIKDKVNAIMITATHKASQ